MLLGLHILRELVSDEDFVHYAIYTMSAMVGLILMVAALYNIYTITFHKSKQLVHSLVVYCHSHPSPFPPSATPRPSSISETPSTFPSMAPGGQGYGNGYVEEDDLDPSRVSE